MSGPHANDTYTCPKGGILRHTATNKDGKRTYRSTPEHFRNRPCKAKCGANEKGQKVFHSHIWQDYLDIMEQLCKTERAKNAMRYIHHRGLAAVTRWVRLKYAAMNLKKLAAWSWNNSSARTFLTVFFPYNVAISTFT